MQAYVQINEEGVVIGVSELDNTIDIQNMIEIPNYNELLLGATLEKDAFIKSMIMEETDTYIKYQWNKFNFEIGKYEFEPGNLQPIIVDGAEYPLIDGIATVPKVEPVDPIDILGQQLAEEKIKNIQNTAVINQLGQELTNIKLQLLMNGGM